MVKRGKINIRHLVLAIIFCTIILLSGCITITMNQKLYRNGHFDYSITIPLNSQLKSMTGEIKEEMKVPEEYENNFELIETDTSLTFLFKDIDPQKMTSLFSEKSGSDRGVTPFDPSAVNFRKEFKFPYYVFTYEVKMDDDKIEETSNDEDRNNSNSSFQMSGMDNIVTLEFIVETFGTVIQTNGEKISRNKVKFLLNDDTKVLKIVFKDFFLVTLLGRFTTFFISVACLLLGLGVGFIIVRRQKHEKELGDISPAAKMNSITDNKDNKKLKLDTTPNPALIEYIKKSRAYGFDNNKIKENLLKAGWQQKDINEALKL